MPSTSVLQNLAICAATWTTWRMLRALFSRDPFENIPGPPPESWFTGNIAKLRDKDGWEYHEQLGKKYGRVFSWTALFKERCLYVFDPTALQHIFVKDQHIYEEVIAPVHRRTLGKGLTSASGEEHRKQRKILNPVFSTVHIRDMIPTFYDVAHELRNGIEKDISQGQAEIDMFQWMNRVTLELIGRSGFGTSFDSLEPGGKGHPVGHAIRSIFPAIHSGGLAVARRALHRLIFDWGITSPRFERAIVNILPWPALHSVRDNVDLVHETSAVLFEEAKRRVIGEEKDMVGMIGGGKDIMRVLIKANMAVSEEDKLQDDEILGQISSFLFAGADTTSNSLARVLDLLSHYPDAQIQLREEVIRAQIEHGGDLDFDTIMGLPYLDAVCRETLRLHATVPFLQRRVRQDTMLPFQKPIIGVNGREISKIFIPKGTCIVTSQIHCNRDPEIWGPDACEWKPERWLIPLPQSVFDAKVPGIYSHLTTFSAGSRACIGVRFALLEMKVILSTLIQTFTFEPTGQKIMWQMGGVVTQPTTEDAERNGFGERKFQLPMRVTLVDDGK